MGPCRSGSTLQLKIKYNLHRVDLCWPTLTMKLSLSLWNCRVDEIRSDLIRQGRRPTNSGIPVKRVNVAATSSVVFPHILAPWLSQSGLLDRIDEKSPPPFFLC